MKPIFWAVLGLSLSACTHKSESESFGRLTVEEVAAKRSEKSVYIYDNNPKGMFDAAHVPGAKWLDSSAITAADLPEDKAATLIFYCANEH